MGEAAPRHAGRLPRKTSRPADRATPPIVAVIDREGMVIGLLASRIEARTFLRETRT